MSFDSMQVDQQLRTLQQIQNAIPVSACSPKGSAASPSPAADTPFGIDTSIGKAPASRSSILENDSIRSSGSSSTGESSRKRPHSYPLTESGYFAGQKATRGSLLLDSSPEEDNGGGSTAAANGEEPSGPSGKKRRLCFADSLASQVREVRRRCSQVPELVCEPALRSVASRAVSCLLSFSARYYIQPCVECGIGGGWLQHAASALFTACAALWGAEAVYQTCAMARQGSIPAPAPKLKDDLKAFMASLRTLAEAGPKECATKPQECIAESLKEMLAMIEAISVSQRTILANTCANNSDDMRASLSEAGSPSRPMSPSHASDQSSPDRPPAPSSPGLTPLPIAGPGEEIAESPVVPAAFLQNLSQIYCDASRSGEPSADELNQQLEDAMAPLGPAQRTKVQEALRAIRPDEEDIDSVHLAQVDAPTDNGGHDENEMNAANRLEPDGTLAAGVPLDAKPEAEASEADAFADRRIGPGGRLQLPPLSWGQVARAQRLSLLQQLPPLPDEVESAVPPPPESADPREKYSKTPVMPTPPPRFARSRGSFIPGDDPTWFARSPCFVLSQQEQAARLQAAQSCADNPPAEEAGYGALLSLLPAAHVAPEP